MPVYRVIPTKDTLVFEDGTYRNPVRLAWGRIVGVKVRSLTRFAFTPPVVNGKQLQWADVASVEKISLVAFSSDGDVPSTGGAFRGGTPKVSAARLDEDWSTGLTWAQLVAIGTVGSASVGDMPTANTAIAKVDITATARPWLPASLGGTDAPNNGLQFRVPDEGIGSNNADAWGMAYSNADRRLALEIEYELKADPAAPGDWAAVVGGQAVGLGGTAADAPLLEPAGVVTLRVVMAQADQDKGDWITAWGLRFYAANGTTPYWPADGLRTVDVDDNTTPRVVQKTLGPGYFADPGLKAGDTYAVGFWVRNRWNRWGPESARQFLRGDTRPGQPLLISVDYPDADHPYRPRIQFTHNDADPGSTMSEAAGVITDSSQRLLLSPSETYLGGKRAALTGPDLSPNQGFGVQVRTTDSLAEGALQGPLSNRLTFTAPPPPPPDPVYDLRPPDACAPSEAGQKQWGRQIAFFHVEDSAREFDRFEVETYLPTQVTDTDVKPDQAPYRTYTQGTMTATLEYDQPSEASPNFAYGWGQDVAWRARIRLDGTTVFTEWTPVMHFPVDALPRGPVITEPAYGALVGEDFTVTAASDDPDALTHGDLIIEREYLLEHRTSGEGEVPETWEEEEDRVVVMADTTLAASTAVGATVAKYTAPASGSLTAGEAVWVGTFAQRERRIISVVGTAGAGGTGLTLTEPLGVAHASGDALIEELPTSADFTSIAEGVYAVRIRDKDQNTEDEWGEWSAGGTRHRFTVETGIEVTEGDPVDDADPTPLLTATFDETPVTTRWIVRDEDGLVLHDSGTLTGPDEYELPLHVLAKTPITWTYEVIATGANGLEGSWTSDEIESTFATPDPIEGLTALASAEEMSVALSWDASSSDFFGEYVLTRTVGSGASEEIYRGPDTSFTDEVPFTNRDMTYYVQEDSGAETSLLTHGESDVDVIVETEGWALKRSGYGQLLRFRAESGGGRSDTPRVTGHVAAGRPYPVAVEDVMSGPTGSFTAFFIGPSEVDQARQLIADDFGGPGLGLITGNGYAYRYVKVTQFEETGEDAGIRHVQVSWFRVG